MDFVSVPQGPYTKGIANTLSVIPYDFLIMKYEVTNLQYFIFLRAALSKKMVHVKNDTILWDYPGDQIRPRGRYTAKLPDPRIYFIGDSLKLDTVFANHPVTGITWFGATAFCQWYGFSLPDKFEWEKAARGKSGWNYPWGDSLDSHRANYHNSGDPFDNGTTPVGFYNGQTYQGYLTKDSPSPFGCYDMAGNAWEYTNTTLFDDKAVYFGGGGSYLYHTGAMTQSWYFSSFGNGSFPFQIDRPFISDGFRCILK